MKLASRSSLGWPPSAAPDQPTTNGVKIHYLGTPFSVASHADCTAHVKQVRISHLANTAENYSDIAYNFLVCRHGYVYEGRGYGKRTGANGNQELNRGHYAVCVLLGSSGDTKPTDEMVDATREVISNLRAKGAGSDILGHRDGYATSCPGDAMYSLVKSGKLEPDVPTTPKDDMDPVDVWAYKGKEARDAWNFLVTASKKVSDMNIRLVELEKLIKQLLAK